MLHVPPAWVLLQGFNWEERAFEQEEPSPSAATPWGAGLGLGGCSALPGAHAAIPAPVLFAQSFFGKRCLCDFLHSNKQRLFSIACCPSAKLPQWESKRFGLRELFISCGTWGGRIAFCKASLKTLSMHPRKVLGPPLSCKSFMFPAVLLTHKCG